MKVQVTLIPKSNPSASEPETITISVSGLMKIVKRIINSISNEFTKYEVV